MLGRNFIWCKFCFTSIGIEGLIGMRMKLECFTVILGTHVMAHLLC